MSDIRKQVENILAKKKLTKKWLAENIDESTGNLNRTLSNVSLEKLIKTASVLEVSIESLLDDDYSNVNIGSKLSEKDYTEEPYITTSAGISFFQRSGGKFLMRVPMVPIYAYAKYIDEFRDAEIWDGDGYFDFPVDQIYHGSYQAFEIKGDSMDDDSKRSLSHGDIVNARELSCDKWRNRLHTDRFPNWIIVTDNTILCKQIVNQDLNTGEITCHSLNSSPEYTDFTINLNEVRKLFNIVQKVSSSF